MRRDRPSSSHSLTLRALRKARRWVTTAAGSTTRGRNSAGSTQSGTPTSRNSALSTSGTRESAKGLVTPSATQPVAGSHVLEENLEGLPCRRSQEVLPASTSSGSKSTLPTAEVLHTKKVPPLSQIEKVINQKLTLSNWPWPRSVAVKGIALTLQRWAKKYGVEEAAKKGDIIFSMPGVLYSGEAPLLGLPCEKLTPELLADRLGGILNGRSNEQDAASGDRQQTERRDLSASTPPADRVLEAGDPNSRERGDEGMSQDGDSGAKGGADLLEFPTKRTNKAGRVEGLSRKDVAEELEESQRDLQAFNDSYNVIKKRVQEVKDEHRMLKLVDWSGTAAVMGTLELTIHAVEHTVAELVDILKRIDSGVIPNLDEL